MIDMVYLRLNYFAIMLQALQTGTTIASPDVETAMQDLLGNPGGPRTDIREPAGKRYAK